MSYQLLFCLHNTQRGLLCRSCSAAQLFCCCSEKKRKEMTTPFGVYEKPSIIPGCPFAVAHRSSNDAWTHSHQPISDWSQWSYTTSSIQATTMSGTEMSCRSSATTDTPSQKLWKMPLASLLFFPCCCPKTSQNVETRFSLSPGVELCHFRLTL